MYNTQEQRLVAAIVENKKIETQELFNFLISKKALERLESFKVNTATKLFNPRED
jgi:hypothetical protein